jgi:hypothetical protein
MAIFMVQFGSAHLRYTPGNPVGSLIAIVLAVFVGGLLAYSVGFLAPRARRATRAWVHRRRRLRAAANVERRARAMMDELCPHGWRAQITLLDGTGDYPAVGPTGEPARVALDWIELEDESGRAAVSRRVWARTISEALDAMVADRRMDETLEQIERAAAADGAPWPEP